MSTLKVNQIQNLNGDVLLSSSGSDANLTLSGELRGPSTFIIDPAVVGDDTGTVRIKGNLEVLGTGTTINSVTLTIDDKNIVLGDGATTDVQADGGGITLRGASDKTINWVDATDAWTSSERFSVPLGSATAPSLTFTGDPNSGVYSPGADQVAIATGGVGRLFVNSTGQVSIGTTAGGYGLRVANGLLIDSSSLSIQDGYAVAWGNTTVAGNNNGNLVFRTAGSERLRITSTGLVGIGATSPNTNFEVVANKTISNVDSFGQLIVKTTEGGTGNMLNVGVDETNSRSFIQSLNRGTGTTPLLLNPYGSNVGIGTTNPTSLLTINGGGGATNLTLVGRGHIISTQNWNFATLRLERELSNTTSTKLISFVLDGDSDSDTNLYSYPNLVLKTSSAPTTGSTSAVLSAKLEITAPTGVDLGVGTKPILKTTSNGIQVDGTISESTDGGTTYHNVVTAQDIGTDPNQVPLNQFLGQLAFMDQIGDVPTASSPPQDNLSVNFEYVSNTSIKIRMRGTDGVVRSVTLTLA